MQGLALLLLLLLMLLPPLPVRACASVSEHLQQASAQKQMQQHAGMQL
jgi:hypothetical protein